MTLGEMVFRVGWAFVGVGTVLFSLALNALRRRLASTYPLEVTQRLVRQLTLPLIGIGGGGALPALEPAVAAQFNKSAKLIRFGWIAMAFGLFVLLSGGAMMSYGY